jgi:hypothetical protein
VPGTAATTGPVQLSMVQTAPRAWAAHIILRRGLTLEALRSRLPTVLEVPVKHTTQALAPTREGHQRRTPTAAPRPVKRTTPRLEPMAPRVKPPTLTGTTEARSSQRTARRRTPSIKQPRRDPWVRYKLRRAAKAWRRRVHTATRLRAKRQMATSTRPQMGMSTRIPEAVGSKRKELRNLVPVTRQPVPLLHGDSDSRKKAAGHRPLLGAAAVAGNPGRRVRVVRRAAAAAAAGAVASDGCAVLMARLKSKFWRIVCCPNPAE